MSRKLTGLFFFVAMAWGCDVVEDQTPAQPCDPTLACSSEYQRRCDDQSVYLCEKTGGCLGWSLVQTCSALQPCVDGFCQGTGPAPGGGDSGASPVADAIGAPDVAASQDASDPEDATGGPDINDAGASPPDAPTADASAEEDTDGELACTPVCDGVHGPSNCGDDGCGGSCGSCSAGWSCVDGSCEEGCTPSCIGKECGDDGCGGSCGSCPIAAPVCTSVGACAPDCEPDCDAKECGGDGCGGSCGSCPGVAPNCTEAGICAPDCKPDCEGRECGDDGCGGSCGDCTSGLSCLAAGRCFDAATMWYDALTGLTWQSPPAPAAMKWADGVKYCDTLSLGVGGWHLPTIGELRSLIVGCAKTESAGTCNVADGGCTTSGCAVGCIGCAAAGGAGPLGCYWPAGLAGTCTYYWSSTPVADKASTVWDIWFYTGVIKVSGPLTATSQVRCVR